MNCSGQKIKISHGYQWQLPATYLIISKYKAY